MLASSDGSVRVESPKAHESKRSAQVIENADGFAQVFPEHKFPIIDVLHIVAMTGDGVNDAPALKEADCGIAVSGASAAARAAADIVLLVGPVAAFGLFYLGASVFHLDRAHLQTLMYLMLSVAGSLTIFLTRTRGPIWSIRLARILLLAVLGAEVVASCLALLGIFMPSVGWHWVLFVWVCALAWFLVTDRVKRLAYRVFDPTGVAGEPGEDGTSEPEVPRTAAMCVDDDGRHAAIG